MRDFMKNSNCSCDLKDLLYFNRLIMPRILTFIYWILLGVVILSGLSTLFTVGFFAGVISIVAGVIFTRIVFEIIIVVFTINRNLEKLVELQHGNPDRIPGDEVETTRRKQPKRKNTNEDDMDQE